MGTSEHRHINFYLEIADQIKIVLCVFTINIYTQRNISMYHRTQSAI